MKTISCPFILTIIGVGMNLTFGIQVSSINCGDVCSAEEGSPYNMTCSWTGSLTTGILWSNGVNNILTCNPAGQCLEFDDKYAKGNYYPNGTTALITILSYNPSTDAVAWTCRDGSDDPLYCTLPRPAIGTLQGNCTKDGNRYDLTCSGLTDHGTPAVELQIKLNGVVKARNSTGGSVSSSTGEAGESYTCEVSGEAACLASAPFQCETPSTTPSTPEATTATPTSTATTSSTVITIPVCVNVTICIVVGCIGGVAVVTGIFICCCCCPCCLPSCFPSQCPCCCRRARKKKSVTNGQTRTTSAEGEEQVAIDDYPTSQKTKGDDLEKRNGSVDNEDISIKIRSDGMRDDRALYPVRKNESGMHRL